MLAEEFLIVNSAGAIGSGIPPAVEEIAASGTVSPAVPCGLRGCGAVVDYPDLIKVVDTEQYLIQLFIVGYRVNMIPVRNSPCRVIDII